MSYDPATSSVMNPDWFGAIGDGNVANAAVNNAAIIKAVSLAAGRDIQFGQGHYRVGGPSITGPLFQFLHATTIKGAGANNYNGTWIDPIPGTPGYPIFQWAPAGYEYYYGMENIFVYPTDTIAGGPALDIITTSSSAIEMGFVRECHLWGGATGFALHQSSTAGATTGTIHQMVVEHCEATGGQGSFWFEAAGDSLVLRDCDVTGPGTGVIINARAGSGTASQLIEELNVRGMSGGAVQLINCAQAKIISCQLEQGVASLGDAVVILNNCQDCQIEGSNINAMNNIPACIGATNGTARTRVHNDNVLNGQGGKYHFAATSTAGSGNRVDADNTFQDGTALAAPNFLNLSGVYQGGIIPNVVAQLPTPSLYPGLRLFVSDATATTYGSTPSGGGSNKVWVESNGTSWLID